VMVFGGRPGLLRQARAVMSAANIWDCPGSWSAASMVAGVDSVMPVIENVQFVSRSFVVTRSQRSARSAGSGDTGIVMPLRTKSHFASGLAVGGPT